MWSIYSSLAVEQKHYMFISSTYYVRFVYSENSKIIVDVRRLVFKFRSKEKSVRNLWKLAAPVGDSSTKMDSSRFEDETWCVCFVEEEARVSSSSTGSRDEEGSSSLPFQLG